MDKFSTKGTKLIVLRIFSWELMNTNQTVADVNSDMDDAWMEPFQDLKQYKVKEGRCNDPQDYLGTHQLGTRDNTQISQNRFLQPHTE